MLIKNPMLMSKKSIVKDGLVLWLDGHDFINSPLTALWKDRAGLGNDATPSSFAYTPASGADGVGGVVLDGVNDYCSIANSTSINLNGNFTVQKVINGTRSRTSETLLAKTSAVGIMVGFFLILRSSQPYIKTGIFDTSLKATTFNVADPRDGNRHVIVGKKEGNVFSIYVDGIFINSQNVGATDSYLTPNPIYLGADHGDNGYVNYFGGKDYQTLLYNRALTDPEILQNYKASR